MQTFEIKSLHENRLHLGASGLELNFLCQLGIFMTIFFLKILLFLTATKAKNRGEVSKAYIISIMDNFGTKNVKIYRNVHFKHQHSEIHKDC